MSREAEFMECSVCAGKPGAPVLCESCLHNRSAINKEIQMDAKEKARKDKLADITKKLSLAQNNVQAASNAPEGKDAAYIDSAKTLTAAALKELG